MKQHSNRTRDRAWNARTFRVGNGAIDRRIGRTVLR